MKEDKKNKSQNQNSELSNDDLESVAGGGKYLPDGRYMDDSGQVWGSNEDYINVKVKGKIKAEDWTVPPMTEVDFERIMRGINSESDGE